MIDPKEIDWLALNGPVIDEYRANDGRLGGRWEGNPTLLLTTTGRRSGQQRTSPLTYTADGDNLVLIASRAGDDRHPDWFHNLVADPDVTVELGGERFSARASVAGEPDRTRLFDERIAAMPRFGDYKTKTDREIPVVVIERQDENLDMTFAHPEFLVSTEWLADHLDDPGVLVLDVTAKLSSRLDNAAGRQCWQEGHIPGSVFFDVPSAKGVLSEQQADLPWMWPTPQAFEATMAEFGVAADTRVVLVARTPRPGIDSGTMWCTRAWWTLHHFGVDCAVLHGGLERWEAEGRPLIVDDTARRTTTGAPLKAAAGWQRARATGSDVLEAVNDIAEAGGHVCLVDALSSESYDGTEEAYGRPGHITGAINVPFRSLIVDETCGFVDAAAMRTSLTEAGLLDAPKVITYCGGAIAATVDAFCLALLGHEGVAVYDGSLMEWTADPDLPMSTG